MLIHIRTQHFQTSCLYSTIHHHSASCLAATSQGRKRPKQTHTYDVVIARLAWGAWPFRPITASCEEAFRLNASWPTLRKRKRERVKRNTTLRFIVCLIATGRC